ncbi:hypothetical protein Nepgr_017625 [Nepenthes gracilis]|uniref:Uncharacterized protein n=1 Tax=Nepenthes gracilis TaxID=150966 RepID=A0AAD3SRX1_NEPGR|nr:hypothetical protein Nepgr_017625 [Nepenthes gracilis]
MHEKRFPAPPGHLQGSELDRPGNLPMGNHPGVGPPVNHSRAGDVIFHDVLLGHLRRDGFTPVGSWRNADTSVAQVNISCSKMFALRGLYKYPDPFSLPLPQGGRDAITKNPILREDQLPHKLLYPKPKKRSNKQEDNFFESSVIFSHRIEKKAPHKPPVEKETFDYSGKRKPVMCRICRVDCKTMEGLDLHSQTREHQKKAIDMVLRIKQQNSKKQRTSNDRSSLEDGNKSRNASFEGHGNKQ